MDKVREYLREWIVRYIENKDIFRKNIVKISENSNHCDVFVKYKDKNQAIIIVPVVDDFKDVFLALEDIRKKEGCTNTSVVVLNNTLNLDSLKDSWDDLISEKTFSVYFVNPISMGQRLWIIYPCTHEKISDRSTVGSLFASVEEIEYEEIERRL